MTLAATPSATFDLATGLPRPPLAVVFGKAAASIGRRNDVCICGSGMRLKQCCGRLNRAFARDELQWADLMSRALALHRAGSLDAAAALYEEALQLAPDLPDAVHMLGVIRLQQARIADALTLLHRAARLTNWQLPAVIHNLCLALPMVLADRDLAHAIRLWTRYEAWQVSLASAVPRAAPLVSVIVPSYNHARFAAAALASVYAQTYRRVELVVIDDGSTDGSPAVLAAALAACPFPHRLIARENRGAAVTINEGVALAAGDFVNVLNSDDEFEPDRLAVMVERIARPGARWGFADVCCVDTANFAIAAIADSFVDHARRARDRIPASDTVGLSFLGANAAISTGNMFIETRLARMVGFRDLRYNHDWDFALRAALEAEPVHVAQPLYRYRRHERNTIAESATTAEAEMNAMLRDFYVHAIATKDFGNPFAPAPRIWRNRFWQQALTSFHDAAIPVKDLRALLLQLDGETPNLAGASGR
jgi:glycosyltransferase involved in cell wall biosynthesis